MNRMNRIVFAPLLVAVLGAAGVGGCGARPDGDPPKPAEGVADPAPVERAAQCERQVAANLANLDAHRCELEAMRRIGRLDTLLERRAGRRTAHPDDPTLWYLEAEALLGPAPDQARAVLERCTARFPESAWCALGTARLEADDGRPEAGLIHVARGLDLDPDHAGLRALESRLTLAMGDPRRALTLAEAAHTAHPGDLDAVLALAEARIASGAPDQAWPLLASAAEAAPDGSDAAHLRARVRTLMGDPERALEDLKAALAADPYNHSAREMLARMLIRNDHAEDAVEHLGQLVDRYPDSDAYALLMGEALLSANAPRRALRWSDKVRTRGTLAGDAELLRARALIAAGEVEEALALRDTLYADPDAAPARRVAVARALSDAQQVPLAEAEFAAATEAHPDSEATWRAYGRWHYRAGRFGRSVTLFRQAVDRHPRSALLHYDLADALEEAGDREEARDKMAIAARLDPSDPDYGDELARLEFVLGDSDEAIRRWEALVAQHPRAWRARLHLSTAYLGVGRAAEAATMLEALQRTHPGDENLLVRLGEARARSGDHAGARVALRAALEAGADESRVLPLLAMASAAEGDLSEARSQFERALALDPSNRAVRLAYARVMIVVGEPETAEAQYRAALARSPYDLEALEGLASVTGVPMGELARDARLSGAASADPTLRALVSEADRPEPDQQGTVLRDERYVRVDDQGVSTIRYVRSVLVERPGGVERYGQVAVPFHGHRRPTVHLTRILTPDGAVEMLPASAVRVTNPYADTPLFGEARRLELDFTRVEPGAIIDYEVTVHRPHPEPLGAWWDAYVLANLDPTVQVRYVLDMPAGSEPVISAPGLPEPIRRASGGRVVLEWARTDVPGFPDGFSDTPDPADDSEAPAIYVSSLPDWAAVDGWYHALFAPMAVATPELVGRAEALVGADRRETIANIYREVERRVEYLGIELGVGAYKPRAAGETFANRQGDCKDMTALMVAMLAATGIQAYPALIRPRGLGQFVIGHPSPGQFNHVLLYVPDAEGDLWLDPTAGLGTLTAVPDVLRGRQALVVDGSGGRVITVPDGAAEAHYAEEHLRYELNSTGGGTLRARITLGGDPAGEARRRLLELDAAGVNAMLRAPGYILGSSHAPDSVEVAGLGDPRAPLEVEAHTAVNDLVGVRLDGALVVPLTITSLASGIRGRVVDARRLRGPLRVQRTLELNVPRGYRFEWAPLRFEVSDMHARIAVRERRTRTRSVVVTEVEFREAMTAPLRRIALMRLLAEHEPTLERLLVTRPGPDFDRVAFLAAIAAERPDSARVWTLLGQAQLESGAHDAAVATLRRAYRLEPTDQRAASLFGLALLRAERQEEAEALFRTLAEPEDAPPEVFLALSALLMADERAADAADVLRNGVSRHPDDESLGRRLVAVLMRLDDSAAALVEARRQAGVRPKDGELHAMLGDLAAEAGRLEEAEGAYRVALEIAPDSARVLNNLAWMLRNEPARRDEALALARRSVDLDPSSDAAWDTLAELLYLSGEPRRAMEAIDKALDLNPDRRDLYQRRRDKYEGATD